MATKENQRIALTKRLLQEGLLNLLEHQPVDKISVTELCRISGINRSTFYNHYSSPQDILTELQERVTQGLKEIASRHQTRNTMVDAMEELCIHLRQYPQIATILLSINTETDFVEVIRLTRKHFMFGKDPYNRDADPDSLHLNSTFVCAGCYYMIREWLIRDIPKTPREVAEMATAFIMGPGNG